ncbi:MAG TPA: T9SS type A sorting domain-containing protein [Edaphocola sp.]|nr:T9SS type A sorting domain-containing protein [Edaphocola sp.]
MIKRLLLLLVTGALALSSFAQFPPQALEQGNDAIPADINSIVGWATGCTVQRGWQNIMDTTLGKTTSGSENSALGVPDLDVVSLGDGGSAIVTFAAPVKDGPGPDFAIFENGFADPQNGYEAFLELAFVSVSSDGLHYVTFPATSLTQDTSQIAQTTFGYTDARLINNLAGKYINGYGTPFDLAELADSPNLDVQNIRYIKVTDVVGSIDPQYARYDHDGHIINDPFPSPFPTGGFDLNAVAVLHQQTTGITDQSLESDWRLWPVPAHNFVRVETGKQQELNYRIYGVDGKVLKSGKGFGTIKISVADLLPGNYFIRCISANGNIQTLNFIKD